MEKPGLVAPAPPVPRVPAFPPGGPATPGVAPEAPPPVPAPVVQPAPSTRVEPAEPVEVPEPQSEGPRKVLLLVWFVVLLLGAAALGGSAVLGFLGHEPTIAGLGELPGWLDGAGAVAVVTSLSWLLATRTAGRALISAGLALALGVASILVGGRVLPTGAAVLTCVVGSVYAVMVTVPAIGRRRPPISTSPPVSPSRRGSPSA